MTPPTGASNSMMNLSAYDPIIRRPQPTAAGEGPKSSQDIPTVKPANYTQTDPANKVDIRGSPSDLGGVFGAYGYNYHKISNLSSSDPSQFGSGFGHSDRNITKAGSDEETPIYSPSLSLEIGDLSELIKRDMTLPHTSTPLSQIVEHQLDGDTKDESEIDFPNLTDRTKALAKELAAEVTQND